MLPFLLLDKIQRGLEVQQYGDGSATRDFTFVADIVDGVVAVHDKRVVEPGKAAQHEIFNLGNTSPISLRDYIALTERITGRRANLRVVDTQAGDVQHTFADCSKAQRMVGYEPRVSTEEGMTRTYRWYMDEYTPWRESHPLPEHGEQSATTVDGHRHSPPADTASNSPSESHLSSPISTSSKDFQHLSPGVSARTLRRASHSRSPAPAGALEGVLMCTRVHCHHVDDATSFLRSSVFRTLLHGWIEHAVRVAAHVAIAVDCTDGRTDVTDAVEAAVDAIDRAERVQLVRVAPWGQFVPALNALLHHAQALEDVRELYCTSLEACSSPQEVAAMQKELRASDAMLVGVRLQGHQWHGDASAAPSSPSAHIAPLSGLTCPWNTNAMWAVRPLSRTGFLAVSEDAVHGGVEEVVVVATHAALQASTHAASHAGGEGATASPVVPLAALIDFIHTDGTRSSTWHTEWQDAGRRAWHAAKMASKAERAQWQLEQVDLVSTLSQAHVSHKTIVLD